ncbi:hypothetical protein [Lacticaseibacillus parakribbianus]|uniref:hypothetical protein n=1 Tax=Lacticaseibacillus parakribbianus TaxID=2970927 RepID=UPI0021CB2535|nr:hypothetical protein [Lacticaseibacillus parakribbianus]
MADGTLTISELTPEAQHAAVESFAKFYLDKYQHEGLDLFAQIDTSGHIADINQWLVDNVNFLHDEKLQGLVQNRSDNFIALLKVLKSTFNANGIPDIPWQTWFDREIAAVAQGR